MSGGNLDLKRENARLLKLVAPARIALQDMLEQIEMVRDYGAPLDIIQTRDAQRALAAFDREALAPSKLGDKADKPGLNRAAGWHRDRSIEFDKEADDEEKKVIQMKGLADMQRAFAEMHRTSCAELRKMAEECGT